MIVCVCVCVFYSLFLGQIQITSHCSFKETRNPNIAAAAVATIDGVTKQRERNYQKYAWKIYFVLSARTVRRYRHGDPIFKPTK